MGVDTKGVVATDCKDVMFVCGLVESGLNRLIRPHRKLLPANSEKSGEYRGPFLEIHPASAVATFNFTYAGEKRSLRLNFDCDCDNQDLAPKSLSMSLGCWGQSELFIRTAVESLAVLGPGFVDRNDCDDVGYIPLSMEPQNFLTACAAGLELLSGYRLEKWCGRFKEGAFGSRSFEEAMGMTRDVAESIIKMDYDAAKARLATLLPAKKSKKV